MNATIDKSADQIKFITRNVYAAQAISIIVLKGVYLSARQQSVYSPEYPPYLPADIALAGVLVEYTREVVTGLTELVSSRTLANPLQSQAKKLLSQAKEALEAAQELHTGILIPTSVDDAAKTAYVLARITMEKMHVVLAMVNKLNK